MNISLKTWIENFNKGMYNEKDTKTQIAAGWFDWFCEDKSLAGKTQKLAPKVKRIAKSPKINPDTSYLLFKNNCPLNGALYDDFRICDMTTGDVIYTVIPKCTHSGMAEVWGQENEFEEPIVKGSWGDVLNFFDA